MITFLKLLQSINRCDCYVFLWCLYQLQDILYPSGIINQGIQALIMAWAVYEAGIYMLPQRKLPLMLKATSMMLLMYFTYGIVFIVGGADYYDRPLDYLKSFVNSFLPIYLFYVYAERGYLDEKRIRLYFFLFLCIIIPQYFHAEEKALEAIRKRGSSRTETTNNTGYFFVSLFPMLFFWYKNRIVQYGAMCIILLFVLMGMKRGAIGIAGICAIWFLWNNIKNASTRKHKYQTVAFGIAMIVFAIGAVGYQLSNSDYFQQRVDETKEGDTSARNQIYSGVLDVIVNDDSYIHLFIGRGAYSTVKEIHAFAHQDWLETACNNGIVGITILIFFFYAFFKTAKDGLDTIKTEYQICMMMLFFASFAKTWFSMSLEDMPIYVTMPMAYLTFHTYRSQNSPR